MLDLGPGLFQLIHKNQTGDDFVAICFLLETKIVGAEKNVWEYVIQKARNKLSFF